MQKNAVVFVSKITRNISKNLLFLSVLASNWMVKNHQKQPKDRPFGRSFLLLVKNEH